MPTRAAFVQRRSGWSRAVRGVVVLVLIVVLAPYGLALAYRAGHPVSTLMLWRWLAGAPVSRQWVPLEAISPVLIRSVIAAEDARFCRHRGVDWGALADAIEDAQDGDVAAGGSTITQQTVKNLFLWPGRSFVRKALELPLALWIDLVLPKRRVLEIYLNIAEWGPEGQFGAEAGARRAFGVGANALGAREAALLAAILPNPVTRNAARPSPALLRRAQRYMGRAAGGQADIGCLGSG